MFKGKRLYVTFIDLDSAEKLLIYNEYNGYMGITVNFQGLDTEFQMK